MTDLLQSIIKKFHKKPPKDDTDLYNQLREIYKGKNHPMPSKALLIKAYHELIDSGKLKPSELLETIFRKRSVRTLSGVTIITVLSRPFPCPGKCIYCPNEKGMPKSYISDEPAAARALALDFNPEKQVIERIKTLKKNGHPTDKIELIVKGGSWNAYPLTYQYWFIWRCFFICNHPKSKIKSNTYKPNLKPEILLKKILIEQKKNESANHRIIGLTLETRPDLISTQSIKEMRAIGCTRIELGVQSTDDKILTLIKRGHNIASVKQATKLLKQSGFKVDFHLMPQLPGSSQAKDKKMLNSVFEDDDLRPDMIKIYPCTVTKNSPLYRWVKNGQYKPYNDKQLLELLIDFKSHIPRYVRISRLIRDIPGHHIVAGNKMTNLRQVIQAEMKKRNLTCQCLRCREAGHQNLNSIDLKKIFLFIDQYSANKGQEYFLSFEDKDRKVVLAFCRLRIDSQGVYPAFIRELHTYGQAIKIGQKNKRASQHQGLGTKLVLMAEKICRDNDIGKLAIISGVGVRGYYRKLGYRLENGYMVKKINT